MTTTFTSEQKALYREGALKLTEGQVEVSRRMAKKRKWTLERSILETVYLVYFGPNQREDIPRPTDDLAAEIAGDMPLPNTADRAVDLIARMASASPAEIEQINKILKI